MISRPGQKTISFLIFKLELGMKTYTNQKIKHLQKKSSQVEQILGSLIFAVLLNE